MAMVAIMAMAGGAFAATTTTNSTNTLDTPGFAGGVTNLFGCNSTAGGVVACGAIAAAGFVTDAQTGTGTGLANGMPAQVSYSTITNQYTGGVGAATGYALNQGLFGMCAQSGGVQGACPKFVPNPAIVNAAGTFGLLLASGGGTTGTIPGSTNANPQGSVGGFNEATFLTGLVSGFTQAGLTNQLSQQTLHHAAVTGPVGTNADGDYIDQRLSQVTGGVQTLNQAVLAGGSSAASVVVTVDPAGTQAGWALNVDPYGGPNYANSGVVNQAVADSNSGGFGDYGQLFSNTDVTVVNAITPASVPLPATVYNATAAIFSGAAPASLP